MSGDRIRIKSAIATSATNALHNAPMHIPAGPAPVAGVVGAGLLSLAVAMGIGRFAFTPLLPLMLRDGDLSPIAGAEWAMANYVGYLAGALTAARVASHPRRASLIGLVGVAITTLATGLLSGAALAFAGPLLRAIAGVFSAWVLVGASGWCLMALARAGRPALTAWIYTGVGCGIALAGLLAWLGGGQSARWLWLELGLAAALGAVMVAALGAPAREPEAGSVDHAAARLAPSTQGVDKSDTGLVVCYGIFGYGYIVLATFLPAMARDSIDDPIVFGLTWPVFGLAAAVSVAATARWGTALARERIWALAQSAMALGTALPLLSVAIGALIASAVLVGGTFMVATMAGMQLARERHPDNPTPLVARMTIAFACGQIAGPLLIRSIGDTALMGISALRWANLIATLLLAGSAAWLWRLYFARNPLRSDTSA